jgi:hypothetical protein
VKIMPLAFASNDVFLKLFLFLFKVFWLIRKHEMPSNEFRLMGKCVKTISIKYERNNLFLGK